MYYGNRKGITKVLACLVGGVIPDIDYILEYAKYCNDYKRKPSCAGGVLGEYFNEKKAVYVLFHGCELVITGLMNILIRRKKLHDMIALFVVRYTSHMVLDQIGGNMTYWGYLWSYRW